MSNTMSPDLPPQQKVGHSGLYPNDDTRWSVVKGQVMVARENSGVVGPPAPFVFKGVRYQPTPLSINASKAGTPMGDFFYIGGNVTNATNPETMLFYKPIWERDVGPNGLIRQLGANNIGVYGTYNMPPFTMSNPDGSGKVVSSAGNASVDWTALGPIRYVGPSPSYMPENCGKKQAPPYWYHYCHDAFLDMCWNGGVKPIYVFLAVGVSSDAFFSSNPAPAEGYQYTQIQRYYLDAATWLGQSYGHHPAVAGFYVTNESNQSGKKGTYSYREYWDFLNEVGKNLKAGAPYKLTIAGMQDNLDTITTQLMQYVSTPRPGQPAPATELLYVDPNGKITPKPFEMRPVGPPESYVMEEVPNTPAHATDVYRLDLWGWNLYAAANEYTPIIKYLKARKAAGEPMPPVVVSEIGMPQAMRFTQVAKTEFGPQGKNDPYVKNPNGYKAVWTPDSSPAGGKLTVEPYNPGTILGQESMAVLETTSAARKSPSFFTDNPSYNAGGLVVYENDTKEYYLFQGVPQNPSKPGLPAPSWVHLKESVYGALLEMLRKENKKAAGPAVALYAYLQAAYKYQVNNPGAAPGDQLLSGVQVFEYCDEWYKWLDPNISDWATIQTAAGVQDFRDTEIAPWGPDTAQFYTAWEEEWFGLCSVLPTKRSSTSSAIDKYGWLAGGPDTLTPRSSFLAVQLFFKKT